MRRLTLSLVPIRGYGESINTVKRTVNRRRPWQKDGRFDPVGGIWRIALISSGASILTFSGSLPGTTSTCCGFSPGPSMRFAISRAASVHPLMAARNCASARRCA
jgi:hypothetical protein